MNWEALFPLVVVDSIISIRIARWHAFKPKIPNRENFVGPHSGRFYGHLVYFTAICYILWPFGIFYGYLVYFMVIW
jgi:hypothetical protein